MKEDPTESEVGRQVVLALKTFTDPNAVMQAIADRAVATLEGKLVVRIDGIEKASEAAQADLVRVPTKVQEAAKALGDLVEAEIKGDKQFYLEKFRALAETLRVLEETVDARFVQNDKNTEKAFNAAEKAVSERDSANSKAADKSEKNLMEAIGKINDTIKTLSETTLSQMQLNKDNTDDKVDGLKDRLSSLESRITGGEGTRAGAGALAGWIFGGITALYALVASALLVLNFSHGTLH